MDFKTILKALKKQGVTLGKEDLKDIREAIPEIKGMGYEGQGSSIIVGHGSTIVVLTEEGYKFTLSWKIEKEES